MTHPIALRNSILALFLSVFAVSTVYSQDYKLAWDEISKNNYKAARTHLKQAEKNPATAVDASLTTFLLETFEGHDEAERGHFERARKASADFNPYYFALWKNEGVAGDYGLKSPEQAKFLEQLLEDPKCSEMIKASARYHLSHHYIARDEFKKSKAVTVPIGNLTQWQYTGPFDNVSESGFDKNYPPVEQARPDARFSASNNAEIRWFAPDYKDLDGWIMLGNSIKWNAGIVFAQTFVTAPADMDLVLATGFTGSSIKIWVNDRLVLAEQEQRNTDFDVLKVPCQLKKGVNRVLLQIGILDDEFVNFSVRMLGADGKPTTSLVASTQYAAYPKVEGPVPTPIPFFASEYFVKKIAAEPDNLLNYYLLSATYLRSLQSQEALEIVEKGLAKAPDNLLLRFQHLQCLQKIGNRTALTQEVEDMKRIQPECLISMVFRYEEAVGNENFDEAQELLDRWKELYDDDESTVAKQIQLLLKREKYQEAIDLIAKGLKNYPTNVYLVNLQHNVEVSVHKRPEAGTALYNSFLRKNFNISIANSLANDYIEMGMGSKAVDIFEKLDDLFPCDPSYAENLLNYYYNINEPKKAKTWIDKTLSIAPFHAGYWENAAKLAERSGNKQEALANFQKALKFNPNDYDVRRQIRELEGKPDFATLLPENDPFELYKKTQTAGKEGEHDWYYVLDERCAILYPERNSEVISSLVIKVLNEGGINYWKESSISYNEYSQSLIIEKAEVLKPNGSRVAAEQNGNQLVFPNLQVGDGINIRYRLSNYAFGRMAREFTTPYFFNAFVPTDVSRYCLMVPPSIPINFKNYNHDIQPTVKELSAENLKQYVWESFNEPALKDQRMMPAMFDIAKLLYISTIQDWTEISNWYGDVSSDQAKRDYDVQVLAKELFPAGKTFTETEKAKKIYHWITENIRYSSVPFRQSGLVPQRASRVIQTKLGDCKDLATLFAALGREVNLTANLVLINTRDQGQHAMELPSMDFNHCIVKVMADGQAWYLELTDPELPFGALNNGDIKSFALEIPFGKSNNIQNKPFLLDPANRVRDYRHERSTVEIKGRELIVETEAARAGAVASQTRGNYKDLSQVKRMEDMQASLAKKYTNTLTVKDLSFGDFSRLIDTIQYKVRYNVKNEVMEIGELNTFKIPFFNVFFNSDAFPEEKRVHPVNYWEYEDTDQYAEVINIQIPNGKTITDVPKDVSLQFDEIKYSLKYKQTGPGTLKVVREISTKRDIIPAERYEAFREFAESIINAETRWIAYK